MVSKLHFLGARPALNLLLFDKNFYQSTHPSARLIFPPGKSPVQYSLENVGHVEDRVAQKEADITSDLGDIARERIAQGLLQKFWALLSKGTDLDLGTCEFVSLLCNEYVTHQCRGYENKNQQTGYKN